MCKKMYIFGFLLLFFLAGHSQQRGIYVDDTVNVLQINDSTLFNKVNRFINLEKKCDYYTSDLIFGIHIQSWQEGYFITISSDMGLGVVSDGSLIYGGIMHDGHYVEVIINPDVNDSLKSHFFIKTGKQIAVKRYKPFTGYNSKENIIILESIEDDSYSFWRYFYKNGMFKIVDRHTFCE